MLSRPFILMLVFFKIGPEIRKLQWFGYIENGCHGCPPPYLRLCDVKQPKLNMQNQIIKTFQELFATNFCICFILVISNHFPQNNPNL